MLAHACISNHSGLPRTCADAHQPLSSHCHNFLGSPRWERGEEVKERRQAWGNIRDCIAFWALRLGGWTEGLG